MILKIKCSNETAFTIEAIETDKVSQLKSKISSHFSSTTPTPEDAQRLIFAGKVLKDDETLITYNLQDGNT